MKDKKKKIFMWQNNLCITYTVQFRQFEELFLANSWEICDGPKKADWILVGACAGFLPQIDDYKKKMKEIFPLGKKLAVYGCLPKVAPDEFKESTPTFDVYIPTGKPQYIEKIISNPKVRLSEIGDPMGFRKQDYRKFDKGKKFIIIQNGCNATCVYCPHKIGMGPQKSRSLDEILQLVYSAKNEEAHTIFFEGMDSGSWGTDMEPPQTFLDMIEPILEMQGDFELHIGQFGANWLLHYGEEVIEFFSNPRITDIKIPIQSASPKILKLMGRDSRVLEIGPMLQRLKAKNESLNLRTDLIIGFPTEMDEDLKISLEFARKHFDEVAVFGFEIHPRTPIAKMDLKFLDNTSIENRVRYAIEFLNDNPRIITHRGGEIAETLIEREKKRAEMGL